MASPAARALLLFAALLASSDAWAGKTRGGVAAWVVRDRLTSPKAVDDLCREARRAGVDTLLVQVRGRGDAYYRSALAPRAESLTGAPADFDPLAEVLRRARGLRVVAWLNVYLVWSGDAFPTGDSHVFWAPGDWLLEDRDGRETWPYSPRDRALGWLEGTYADPESEAYRAHFAKVVAEVAAKYRVDGIHLDFVRYPGAGYGMGGPLGERYRREWGFDPRWISEEAEVLTPTTLLSGTPLLSRRVLSTASYVWKDLRAAQVTALVRTVRRKLKAVRRKAELSAAVFPTPGDAYLDKGQDWITWASEGLVDAVFPMVYFGGVERVGSQLSEIAQALATRAPKVRLWAGLGGYIKEPAQIGEEARRAWALGCAGVCLFDWGALEKKPGGTRPYFDEVRGARTTRRAAPTGVAPLPLPSGEEALLVSVLDRAGAGQIRWGKQEREAARLRWAEFSAAQRVSLPAALSSLRASPRTVPDWVDLTGVFRYVNPADGDERRKAQRATAEGVLARLKAGEDLASVAKELSQWNHRAWGGVLNRRYLDSSVPSDRMLQELEPGQLSPVVETHNGFWVYRLEAKGGGETLPVDEMPWPAKRVLFQRTLSGQVDGAASEAGRHDGAAAGDGQR